MWCSVAPAARYCSQRLALVQVACRCEAVRREIWCTQLRTGSLSTFLLLEQRHGGIAPPFAAAWCHGRSVPSDEFLILLVETWCAKIVMHSVPVGSPSGQSRFKCEVAHDVVKGRCESSGGWTSASTLTACVRQAHRFCGRCGAEQVPIEAGAKRQCTADPRHRVYPRTDPVVCRETQCAACVVKFCVPVLLMPWCASFRPAGSSAVVCKCRAMLPVMSLFA